MRTDSNTASRLDHDEALPTNVGIDHHQNPVAMTGVDTEQDDAPAGAAIGVAFSGTFFYCCSSRPCVS